MSTRDRDGPAHYHHALWSHGDYEKSEELTSSNESIRDGLNLIDFDDFLCRSLCHRDGVDRDLLDHDDGTDGVNGNHQRDGNRDMLRFGDVCPCAAGRGTSRCGCCGSSHC